MKCAHIVPPNWTGLFPQGLYRMALAQWVRDHSVYQTQIQKPVPSVRGPEAPYLLMDCGTFEDQQLPGPELQAAAEEINATEIILPDVLGDPEETLSRSAKALKHIHARRVMFVPQGRTLESWKKCLEAWIAYWEASHLSSECSLALGISSLRQVTGTAPQVGSRRRLIEIASSYNYSVHLLGLTDPKEFVTNELSVARELRVRGMDTSTAFAQGAAGQLLTSKSPKILLGSPADYKVLSTQGRRLTLLNTHILNDWVLTGKVLPGVPSRLIRYTASKWLTFYGEGFATMKEVMVACCFPPGRYAHVPRTNKGEGHVRPLRTSKDLLKQERLIELEV